jgi:hypothetical protein
MLLLATVACARTGSPSASNAELATTPARSGARLPVVPMDSATIERLCSKPELVRSGMAECVLRDQSPPVTPVQRTSPPPP